MPDKLPPKRISPTTGLNLLDLGDAPPEQIAIVQTVLKKINVTKAELWEEVQKFPLDKQIKREDFEKVLEELVQSKWLWKTGEGESAVYSGRLKKRYSRLRLRGEMSHRPGSIFTSTWQMLGAKATVEIDREKATGATPTKPRAVTSIKSIAALFSGAQKILLLMLFLSAINFFAVATIDVTGVSGFVETIGTRNLPWISIVEMILGLGVSAIYIQYADRIPSLRLMKIMLGGLVGVYAITAGLFFAAKYTQILDGLAAIFSLKESASLLYPLLYLMRSQQIIVFPIAFWNLANSLYSMSDARKVFPIIASGEMIGGLIGYTLFTEFLGRSALFTRENAFELLVLCGFLYLVILGVIHLIKEPDDDDDIQETESFLQNFKDGIVIIQAVPLFRYLAITVALIWITFPILEYHFYTSLDNMSGAQAGSFENFYSLYSIGLTLIPLFLQWQIIPALTKRVEMRNAFIVLPVALAIGALMINFSSGVYISAIILLITFTIYSSWDSPMINTLQYLVPEDRRGRVGALLNNYAYAFGKIFGSLVLGIILSARLTTNNNSNIYLVVALVAAVGAVITAVLVRLTYDKSMLSWRIARRPRSASVLDKLGDL
jgi:ATP:ADP antiporter, AAA family